MLGSFSLCRRDRKELYRPTSDPQVRQRAHFLLPLDQGQSWAVIATVPFTSTSNRWRQCFLAAGLQAVAGPRTRRASAWSVCWVALVIHWVTLRCPTDFGFVRSRWSCDTVVLLLRENHGVRVSRQTVRRRLHQANLVWRRPRPAIGPADPRRPQKLRKIRAVLRHLPSDETAVFQDEVDINSNPEIGCMWMVRGQQAAVVTPGSNVKRYLAGSLHWRSGELLLSEPGRHRNADLFLAHLDELRRRFRRSKVILVIGDNAVFHVPARCRKVREYLKRWGHGVRLHFLPSYAPETNAIERVWFYLREEITRNHRCKDMDGLLDLVVDWLSAGCHFAIETSLYECAKSTKTTAA